MSPTWPKAIMDPVHNLITFEDKPLDRLLWQLIDCREVQRLRRIKQLGMSYLVFPGATHTRFSHSIGTMQMARRLLARVKEVQEEQSDEQTEAAVTCGALLHDLGHGPFSHTFEKVTRDNHERRTLDVILSSDTEVGRTLATADSQLPGLIAALFRGVEPEPRDGSGQQEAISTEGKRVAPYLGDIISSQLDADRFDYLFRDSWATGAEYGRFELGYILLNLRVDTSWNRLFLGRKALPAAENYVQARDQMYRSVYYHKSVRSAEIMLRLALKRYKDLLTGSRGTMTARDVVSDVSPWFAQAFQDDRMDLSTYLRLDDFSVTEFLKAAASSEDAILSTLAAGLIDRHLWKAIDVSQESQEDPTKITDLVVAVNDLCRSKGYAEGYCFVSDSPADTPYKPYNPDAEHPATQIYVGDDASFGNELSRQSLVISQLTKKYRFVRYHFPAELRDDVERLRAAYT